MWTPDPLILWIEGDAWADLSRSAASIWKATAGALSIFQSNNDPEMRFRFQYKMILKSEWV
jgi:hypothetical protein